MIASSATEKKSPGKQFEAESNVLAIETLSAMNPSSSSNVRSYTSITQASTKQFESCGVCLGKQNRTPDCPIIPNEKMKQLMYLKGTNLCVLQPWKAVLHGEPPQAYLGARGDYHNPNRHKLSFQMAKQPEVGKRQNRHFSKKTHE